MAERHASVVRCWGPSPPGRLSHHIRGKSTLTNAVRVNVVLLSPRRARGEADSYNESPTYVPLLPPHLSPPPWPPPPSHQRKVNAHQRCAFQFGSDVAKTFAGGTDPNNKSLMHGPRPPPQTPPPPIAGMSPGEILLSSSEAGRGSIVADKFGGRRGGGSSFRLLRCDDRGSQGR